mgnify:CR=1 FL=1
MPYIKKPERLPPDKWDTATFFEDVFGSKPGVLNYAFTQTIKLYLKANGTSYRTFNEIVGALECAKLELYRRLIAPYEDTKIQENGDIY